MTLKEGMRRAAAAWRAARVPLALTLVSCLVGLMLAEFTAGFFLPRAAYAPSSVGRSVVLKEYAPNADYRFDQNPAHPESGRHYRLRTEQNGFIIGPGDVGHTDRPIDILFLGDSTTAAVHADEDSRFAYRVGQLLQSPNGSPVYSLNGGVPGASTLDSFFSLLAKAIAAKPRYVVLMHGINDMTQLVQTGSYWRNSNISAPFTLAPRPGQPLLTAVQDGATAMFPHLSALIEEASEGSLRSRRKWANYSGKPASPDPASDLVAMNRSVVRTLRAWGIEPVLMTEYNTLNPGNAKFRSEYERYHRTLAWSELVALASASSQATRQVAAEEHVTLIDLDTELQGRGEITYDTTHLNDAGNRAAADIIAAELAKTYPAAFVLRPADRRPS